MSQLNEKITAVFSNGLTESFAKDVVINRWYTKEETIEEVNQLVQHYQAVGLLAGDAIIVAIPNSFRLMTVFLSALKTGLAVTSVNPELTESELQQITQQQDYQALILAQSSEQSLPTFIEDSFTLEEEMTFPHSLLEGYTCDFLVGHSLSHDRQAVITDDTLAIKMFTSGTTGIPKVVGISHQQLYAAIQNVIMAHQLTSDDRTYVCLPLFHINAQVISLLSTIVTDGKIIVGGKFRASTFWDIVRDNQVTWVSAAPAILSILLKRQTTPFQANTKLRFIRSASASLAPSVGQAFERLFHVPVIESYGMTEAAGQICVNPLPPKQHIFGSVGKPVGVALKVVDERFDEVAAGETGNILIKGASVISDYIDRESGEDFNEGWLITGDVGYLNEAGFLFIQGRKKEIINRGGEKVSPYEVEDVILQLPEVDQVAVSGYPDPVVGQRVFAIIVPQVHGTDVSDLVMKHCQTNLSAYKCPEKIQMVNELPKNTTGKVQRYKLQKI